MHYVIGDIHNDLKKLKQILKQINITKDDELIVLGDVFDRGGETPILSGYIVPLPVCRESAPGSEATTMTGWQITLMSTLILRRKNGTN